MSDQAHKIPELDRKGLRDFAFTTGGIVAGLFGVVFPWLLLDRSLATWPWWPFIFGGVLGLWGLIAPLSLKPVYTGWMKFGLLMSKITTPIIMGAVFYLVFAPIGLVMKLFGSDSMSRKLAKDMQTYRVESKSSPVKNLEKPF